MDLSPLRQQSLLKEDQAKSFRDETMALMAAMESSPDNRIFFDCKLPDN